MNKSHEQSSIDDRCLDADAAEHRFSSGTTNFGKSGLAQRNHDHQRRAVAGPSAEIRRQDRTQCRAVLALLAGARGAADKVRLTSC
jgi:hypothetical protein